MRRFSHYDIAYRIKGEEEYKLVKPPEYGWTADPFLVEYDGKVLLFAEIFLFKSERNGVIGYCEYDGKAFGEWTISMDRHWHLSYPNVFVLSDKLYMIPESYQLGEVVLYELVEFPDKWKKVRSYISDVEYCDTTLLDYKDGNSYMFTFERMEKNPGGKGFIYKIGEEDIFDKHLFSESLLGARCGGKVIVRDNKYIRVGQNSVREYGAGLVFYEIDSVSPEYKEHEIKRLNPEDIKVNSEKEYTGLHTYNELNGIEVIDLKYFSSTQEEEEASDRTRKVFLNKYD